MNKTVGIFLDCNKYWGGQYQYNICLLDALNYLKSKNFEVIAVYTEKSWEDDLKKYSFKKVYLPNVKLSHFLGISLTLINFPFSLWRKVSRFFDPVANRLYKLNADIWIFSSYTFNSYQMPLKSIGVIHDLMHRYERKYPEMGNWKIYYWREQAFKNLCRYNKGIIVDSKLGKQQVIDSYKVSGEKIYILPFIPPDYIYTAENKNRIDDLDNLPDKFIFYPAQFWEHKNHKNLVEAINRLREEIPDIYLVLVGSKKNYHHQITLLVNKYKLHEHVLFLGYISNDILVELYRRARAMIYPSFIGPTNMPPLEAMATNCPAAVSDVYGMKEQLGDAVLYFNPNSIEEIAQTIKTLWKDDELCNELRRRGIERIQRQYTPEIFNKNVMSIINDLTR